MAIFVHPANGGNTRPFGRHVCKPQLLQRLNPLKHCTIRKYPMHRCSPSQCSMLRVCSSVASADVKTSKQGHESLANSILSDPSIEGDPLKFLHVSEAYWQACARNFACLIVVLFSHAAVKNPIGCCEVALSLIRCIQPRRSQLFIPFLCMQAMKNAPPKRGPAVVRVRHRRLTETLDCEVAVCGGTLGLLVALALQVCLCMVVPLHESSCRHAKPHISQIPAIKSNQSSWGASAIDEHQRLRSKLIVMRMSES